MSAIKRESEVSVVGRGTAQAHPSLALIKYWGKENSIENTAATPSLAVTLDGLTTTTRVEARIPASAGKTEDRVSIGGILQEPDRFTAFFAAFRALAAGSAADVEFHVQSSSDFPTAAGLASSASGFAALSVACAAAIGLQTYPDDLAAVSRVGSASAARSHWGGFVRLDAGAEKPKPVRDANWWPDLRIIVVGVESGKKEISSREAMERTKKTSPYYDSWVRDAPGLMDRAVQALEDRNLDTLGPVMRKSYLRMFSTMMSADPPILYWKPASLQVIELCGKLRSEGYDAWETMDAGPQVKILSTSDQADAISQRIMTEMSDVSVRICSVGGPPAVDS